MTPQDLDGAPPTLATQATSTEGSGCYETGPLWSTLRSSPFLRDLQDTELSQLARAAQVREAAKHELVFRSGGPSDSWFIVAEGTVEVTHETPGDGAACLAVCRSGDVFGEMALFDAEPRSATARARSRSVVVAFERAAIDADLVRKLCARITSELSQRLVRAHTRLSRVTAHNPQVALTDAAERVRVELDSIKLLHQHTEKRAKEVLDRAEQRTSDALESAAAVTKEVDRQFDSVRRLLRWIFAPVVLIAGGFGIYSTATLQATYNAVMKNAEDIDQKHQEIVLKSAEATKLLAEGQARAWRARAIVETAGALRGVRDAVGLERPTETRDSLRRAALNYHIAEQIVFDRYLAQTTDAPQYENYTADVVFSAIDTYVALNTQGSRNGQLRLNTETRNSLLNALAYVLASFPDATDPARPELAAELFERKVRELFGFVAGGASPKQLRDILEELATRFTRAETRSARDNLALTMADLVTPERLPGEQFSRSRPAIVQQLHAASLDKPAQLTAAGAANTHDSYGAWHSGAALLALAKLGEDNALSSIYEQLGHSGTAAYPLATLLAEEGADGLAALTDRWRTAFPTESQLESRIVDVLSGYRGEHDCFEERYGHYLLRCLHENPCTASVSDMDCPNYAQ